MDVSQFDYELPAELIAQTPALERTSSRLMCIDRHAGQLEHAMFSSLIDHLREGDTLILNDTKVLPARLFGLKRDTGAKAEVLLLKNLGDDHWEALVKPAKKLKAGDVLTFGTDLAATIEAEGEMGARTLRFRYVGVFNELLAELGQMPLPPYIKTELEEQSRYQTVYARAEGSAAAPTAGLHFTTDYLERIARKGIAIAYVTLHVGLGTFRPVSVDRVEDHEMHAEYYEISAETARIINETRARGGRVIAVGTTTARTLEAAGQASAAEGNELVTARHGWTSIFIYPGYTFRVIDGLITNFHLPKSTLLMLVSAFANRDHIIRAYEEAVKQRYRFFSFGDAMFIY